MVLLLRVPFPEVVQQLHLLPMILSALGQIQMRRDSTDSTATSRFPLPIRIGLNPLIN